MEDWRKTGWVLCVHIDLGVFTNRHSTLAMNPEDAERLGAIDGEFLKVTTEAASAEIELKISNAVLAGQVRIPHGFGLKYAGLVHGVNVN